LVAFFLGAEVFLRRRGLSGTFVGLLPEDVPLSGLLARRATVDLADGRRVTATLTGCVLCQGAFRAGDPVRVNRAGEEYVVSIPLTRRPPACVRAGKG
jgi:hypothetical protein